MVMVFFVVMGISSNNIFAESPNATILEELDDIETLITDEVIPNLECPECPECPPCPECEAHVPKTGQTSSDAPGDDGYYEIGVSWPVPRFNDHGDGTVTDNMTGLMWTKNAQQILGTMG